MPELKLSPEAALFYRDDNLTDPWKTPQTAMLLHGFAESSLAWNSWMPVFGRHLRVLRPDMRGFGKSTPMPADYPWSLDEVLADFIALADSLGIARFHLVAAKVGGIIAIRFAAKYPERLLSFTLNAGGSLSAQIALGGESGRATLGERMQREGMSFVRDRMEQRLGSDSPPEMIEGWTQLMEATPVSTARGFVGKLIPQVEVAADLAKIRVPTLLITTENSPLNPADKMREWQAQIPGAELLVLPGDSYHVAATNPDECARASLAFIQRHSPN